MSSGVLLLTELGAKPIVTHPYSTQIHGWVSPRPRFDVGMRRACPGRVKHVLSRQIAGANVGTCLLHALPIPFNEQEWVGRHSVCTGHAGMLVEERHPEPSSTSIASGHCVLAITFFAAARSKEARQLPGLTGRGWLPGTTAASISLYALFLASSFPVSQLLLPPALA